MSFAMGLVFFVLAAAFVLFATGWLRPDVTALLALLTLAFAGVVGPEEAFSGFSSTAVMAIAGLLVIGDGLERTGVVRWVARRLERVVNGNRSRLLLANTAVPGVLSGFVNIIAAASFFIPVILRLCQQLKFAPSRVLLPMSAAALVGANLTLIGASHNLVVHSLLEEEEGRGFGFFEFTAVGLVLLVVAVLYALFPGSRLLPSRDGGSAKTNRTTDLIDIYELDERLFEVRLTSEMEDRSRTLKDLQLHDRFGITLIEFVRDEEELEPDGERSLRAGDVLLLQARREQIEALSEAEPGLAFMGTPKAAEPYPLSAAEMAEATVPARSPAIGKTAQELDLRARYGLTAIAYYRGGRPYRTHAGATPYEEGDGILLYGPRDRIRAFGSDDTFLLHSEPAPAECLPGMRKRRPWAAAILVVVVLVAALDIAPISVSALAGAVAMILAGMTNPFRSYKAIDWRTIVLIAGMYPVGLALENTGAAELVGDQLVGLLGSLGPLAVMGGVVCLAVILTQPIHNAAVAIIMTPIAINAATQLDASPRAFCVAVLVACSLSFLMPFGHPAALLVEEPGQYSRSHYLRYGLPLAVVAIVVILVLVPLLWPLQAAA